MLVLIPLPTMVTAAVTTFDSGFLALLATRQVDNLGVDGGRDGL